MKNTSKKRSDDICLPSLTHIKKDFALIDGFDNLKTEIFKLMEQLSIESDLDKRASLFNQLIHYTNELNDCLHEQLIKKPNNNVVATAVVKNTQLQAIAAYMLKSISNIWTNEQLNSVREQFQEHPEWNKEQNALWSETYENNAEKLRWGMMLDKIEFDKAHKVTRLTKEERESYRLFLDNGALREFVLLGSGDDSQLVLRNFDTKNMIGGDKKGACIFVISREGKIYASNTQLAKFHHSSLGDDLNKGVSFAGKMIVQNGRIKYIDNSSGHYQPEDTAVDAISMMLSKANAVDAATNLSAFIPTVGLSKEADASPLTLNRREQIQSVAPYVLMISLKENQGNKAGFFSLSSKGLKSIDLALGNFHNQKHLRSPAENIDALDKIKKTIQEYYRVSQEKERASVIEKLDLQVDKAQDYFTSLLPWNKLAIC